MEDTHAHTHFINRFYIPRGDRYIQYLRTAVSHSHSLDDLPGKGHQCTRMQRSATREYGNHDCNCPHLQPPLKCKRRQHSEGVDSSFFSAVSPL